MSFKEVAPAKQTAGVSRRGAVKRLDGEALTRQDLQYDLLSYIFNDAHDVFTDPFSNPPGQTVTFRDLYVSALLHCPKSARSVRDKMAESAVFSTDYAMLSLLANVGRINTSMAFFPETRTALRTYHPVPALQRTDGNLTDAPRIRNALKSCFLSFESKNLPNSPLSILAQRETGPIPTTSVVNLLFVLSQHTATIGSSLFSGDSGLEFGDLFQPVPVPSAERGRAFLWTVFHYLESNSSPNPFAEPSSESEDANPDVAPPMHRGEASIITTENVDTPEEIDYGEKMTEKRKQFLWTDRERNDAQSALRDEAGTATAGPSERGTSGTPAPSVSAKRPKTKTGKARRPGRKAVEPPVPKDGFVKVSYKGQENQPHNVVMHHSHSDGPLTLGPAPSETFHRHQQRRKSKHALRKEPYEIVYAPASPERTMFQQAWHVINTTRDILMDSDEELGDEHVRLDYSRRLQTLNRLRGKSPTPPPEPEFEPEVHLVDPEGYQDHISEMAVD